MFLCIRFLPVIILIMLLWPLLIVSTFATVDIYKFNTKSQQQRYQNLTEELRCPKCTNQNLLGSDSEIASDLRRELHRLLLNGKTDSEIKEFMVARYGDFVLYKPRLQTITLILWLLPIILLILGVLILLVLVNSNSKIKSDSEKYD